MKSLLVIITCIILASCQLMGGGKRITGNSKIVSENRSVGSFTNVEVSGGFEVRLKQDGATSVKIETDENLMQYIEVMVNSNTLVIRSKRGFNLDPSKENIVYVSAPAYKDLDVSGACDIKGEGVISGTDLDVHASGASDINMEVNVPNLSTELSGGGEINFRGRATKFDVSLSGAAKMRCFDLQAEDVNLDVSGASDIEVNASRKLDISASGASDVKYRGNASVSQSSSGASSVKKVG